MPKTNNTIAAIIVGVENGFAGSCPGSLLDARNMKKLLSQYDIDITYLVDSDATQKTVYNAFKKAVNVHELTIFYYSGHGGSQQTYSDSFETDRKDEYLCLYDKGLLDDDIWSIVASTTNRIMTIFDCCHSQTMYRTPMFTKQHVQSLLFNASEKTHYDPNLLCWSGCPDDTYSYGSENGGEMTNCLLKYFDRNLSYKQIWQKMQNDNALKKFQSIQLTIFGTDFSDRLIFN